MKGTQVNNMIREIRKGDILIAISEGVEKDLTLGKHYNAQHNELGPIPKGKVPGHVIVVNDRGEKKAYRTTDFILKD